MAGFRDAVKTFSPPWLIGFVTNVGERFMYSLAIIFDGFWDEETQGVKARIPGIGTPTALPFIGRDRNIERGFQEPNVGYAARLKIAFDTWQTAGNSFTLMSQILAYVTPDSFTIRTVHNNGLGTNSQWDTYAGFVKFIKTPGNWKWFSTNTADDWWKAFVVIYPVAPLWQPGPNWGDPGVNWGQPSNRSWGSTATTDQVSSVRSLVRKWKPANTIVPYVIISFNAAAFDPTLAYPNALLPNPDWEFYSKNVAGTQVRTRRSDARYWLGFLS